MDFPLDVPIPDGTLIAGALLLIRGVDEDGTGTWFIRQSGEPGNQWERIGFLKVFVETQIADASTAWQEEGQDDEA